MVGVGGKSCSNNDVNNCGITRLIIATLKVVAPLLKSGVIHRCLGNYGIWEL
jgi:hypothetical protein